MPFNYGLSTNVDLKRVVPLAEQFAREQRLQIRYMNSHNQDRSGIEMYDQTGRVLIRVTPRGAEADTPALNDILEENGCQIGNVAFYLEKRLGLV